MSVNGKTNITLTAVESLNNFQYHILVNSVGNAGRAATLNESVAGILQNKPQNGENATITMLGRSRCVAGATIVAGADISTTASATAITVTSGGYSFGKAITGVASGGTFELVINHGGVTVVA